MRRFFQIAVRLAGIAAILTATAAGLKAIENADGQRIAPFLKQSEADLAARRPCAIVLDLRYSIGGDYTLTAGFASRLLGFVQPGGHVFVLTTAMTFSATLVTAGYVKQAGGAAVTILGEPVGDRMHFFSEGGTGCLPNSRLCFSYATGKHDFTQACGDPRICFWVDWFYPLRVANLTPDQTVTTAFADWRAARDPVMARAIALARTGNRPWVETSPKLVLVRKHKTGAGQLCNVGTLQD